MAGDTLTPETRLAARSTADIMALKLIVKQLVAEIAAQDRSPEQAEEFVTKIAAAVVNFFDEMAEPKNDTEEYMKEIMISTVDAMFSGINFKRVR